MTCCVSKRCDQAYTRRIRADSARSQRKGERLQRVSGKDSGRLVPFAVDGGLTTAQVVVIHAGQIVMDKAVGVKRLNPSGGGGGVSCRSAMKASALYDKEPP
jgi:hypothetical protein